MAADNELEITLKLVDEASGKIRQITGDVNQQISSVAQKSSQAGKEVRGLTDQLRDATKQFRELRQAAFIATAAIALAVQSVSTASKYNREAKNTFDSFKTSVESLSVVLGQVLIPVVQSLTPVISTLRDLIEATTAGFIKATAFTSEFFTNLSQGPVEAYRRAVEVANIATDDFLRKIEETRTAVEGGMTLEKQSQETINLEKIVVKSARTMKDHWDSVKQAVQNLGSALSDAEELGKGFAKAAAAVALGMAIVNTAQGITAALSGPPNGPPWPLNLALASLIAATGAIQIATIAKTKFAEGTDTVPSMLSPGEMVVPRRFADAIRAGDLTLGGKGGGFGDININIYGADMSSELGIEKTAELLGFEIDRQLRGARSIA